MIDAMICHDQQLDMWYIQRGLHVEEIFPLTLEYMRDMQEENARLRELVDYMTPIALYEASEQERDRMRELGVDE